MLISFQSGLLSVIILVTPGNNYSFQGDDLASIVTDSVLAAAGSEGFALRDRDVIAVTESIVARAQGNYATVQNIADDVRAKLGGGTVGVIFPILSRNRFAICRHRSVYPVGPYRYGIRLPVERLCALAHSYDIFFCLDAAQSAGLLDPTAT